MIDIQIEGLEELKKRLDTKKFAAASKVAIGKCAEEVKIIAIPYPPEGAYNRPGPYPHKWYQRHFGPRWARVSGSPGGRDTSEQMQKVWYTQVLSSWQAKVANKAAYAPWVKGDDQADFHKRHGWTKLEDDAKKVADKMTQIYKEEVDKVLGG